MGGPSDPLAQIPVLYHFTDKSNIPMIRQLGGLFSTALLKEMGHAFCAGGDEDSLALDMRCGMDKFRESIASGGGAGPAVTFYLPVIRE